MKHILHCIYCIVYACAQSLLCMSSGLCAACAASLGNNKQLENNLMERASATAPLQTSPTALPQSLSAQLCSALFVLLCYV